MTIRVGIADDQPMIRDGFRLQVQLAPDLEFVGAAADGEQAVALARAERPDVLLMDVRMPRVDGIEATRRIAADPALADVRVLVLTTFDLDEYVYGALRAGASGFLLKDTSPEDLHRAIQHVTEGGAMLAPQVTRRLIAEFAARPSDAADVSSLVAQLTNREIEVLRQVARGRSNAEVAAELVLSPLTVKTHVSRMLTKLGLHDRTQLVVLAYESGVVVTGAATDLGGPPRPA
ncbi:response regulator transcription factor [Jatrophihabitans telluris]|uniref:Response regulator transcription factor n=1 Tax=Jatrophihabitans telluris TaxID=2038343 RepID=A0ABY4QUE2_9ACTN|nr:response regulator transcription factor [Jatrophihabitans telluris]UQX86867.1 response regulator transcription factor [Jatrophihabitans telluris]